MKMREPDFLICGAAKSGTTSLQKYLNSHPDIFLPDKEINYFSFRYNMGIENYLENFHSSCLRNGEKSTSYIYYQECHARLKVLFPNIKLIVMLREPIQRSYSNWNMRYNDRRLVKDGFRFNAKNKNLLRKLDFEYLVQFYLDNQNNTELVFQKPLDLIHRSNYYEQINSLFKYFDKKQVKLIVYERFLNNIQKCLDELYEFLEVDRKVIKQFEIYRKTSYSKRMDDVTQYKLKEYFKEKNAQLFNLLGYQIDEWK